MSASRVSVGRRSAVLAPARASLASVITTLVLAVAGVGVSVYLTYEHYTGSKSFACPATATINCEKVTTSHWSTIIGIPVAVLGLAFFVGMVVLCMPVFSGRLWSDLRVVGSAVGVVMVLWLLYVELFLVEAICLYCTAVHALTVAMLAATLWRRESERASV